MELYLVRHGRALSEVEDPARPLSPQGREEVGKVARAAVKKGMSPARILHSGKLRAKETAEILAAAVHPAQGVSEIKGLAPQDDPVRAMLEVESEAESVALAGHLPHLEGLFSLLTSGNGGAPKVEFTTATIVCLSREQGKWKVLWSLNPGSA